jgi:hypothetical protein
MINHYNNTAKPGLEFYIAYQNSACYLPGVKGRIAEIRKGLEECLDGRGKIFLQGSNKGEQNSSSKDTKYTLCYDVLSLHPYHILRDVDTLARFLADCTNRF